MQLVKNGAISEFMASGATIRTAFCGPCFGAGDTPSNGALSIRHTTRNFPNREGSKPENGQISSVALMDARSIAATAASGGFLTPATDFDVEYNCPEIEFDTISYDNRVYNGYEKLQENELKYGPNIKDWPKISALTDNILMQVASLIPDEVTTTDELIPSGETSSYRSNPLGLAEFTLSRRDPEYVGKAKQLNQLEKARIKGIDPTTIDANISEAFSKIKTIEGNENISSLETGLGSLVYAVKPGDGSAREQAASCQRVLGGIANIAKEYATKRYRSNLMNWGMIPFLLDEMPEFKVGDYIYVPNIRNILDGDMLKIPAYIIGEEIKEFKLYVADMTPDEKSIVKAGCLINHNRNKK